MTPCRILGVSSKLGRPDIGDIPLASSALSYCIFLPTPLVDSGRIPRFTVHAEAVASRIRFLGSLVAAVLIGSACGTTSSESVTSPDAPKCSVTLIAAEDSIAESGGAGSITVTTQPECAWTAAAEASWITNVIPSQGQGNAEVRFQVSENPNPSARESAIVVNNQRAIIRQLASTCHFSVGVSTTQFAAVGGTGTISVTSSGGCGWTASSDSSWITVAPLSGTGSGNVSLTVAPNIGTVRTGTVTVAGVPITVVQTGAGGGPPSCTVTLQPTSTTVTAAGGPRTVTVNATCAWTASSGVPWITLATPASGSGNGNVGFNVAVNTSPAPRVGSLTIGAATLTVSQAGAPCTATINPTTRSVTAMGGNIIVGVSTATGCPWAAMSHASFVTITAGASGTGNGTVTLSVAQNTGVARTGTATIAGQTFTVNQACASSISPTSRAVGPGLHTEQTVRVTTISGCTWTATSNASWLTITSGVSGTGSGDVTYSVAANSGGVRTGTLTIADQTLTVTQQGK